MCAWQEKNHPWLELSDVHRETTDNIRVTVIPFYMGMRVGLTLWSSPGHGSHAQPFQGGYHLRIRSAASLVGGPDFLPHLQLQAGVPAWKGEGGRVVGSSPTSSCLLLVTVKCLGWSVRAAGKEQARSFTMVCIISAVNFGS